MIASQIRKLVTNMQLFHDSTMYIGAIVKKKCKLNKLPKISRFWMRLWIYDPYMCNLLLKKKKEEEEGSN